MAPGSKEGRQTRLFAPADAKLAPASLSTESPLFPGVDHCLGGLHPGSGRFHAHLLFTFGDRQPSIVEHVDQRFLKRKRFSKEGIAKVDHVSAFEQPNQGRSFAAAPVSAQISRNGSMVEPDLIQNPPADTVYAYR